MYDPTRQRTYDLSKTADQTIAGFNAVVLDGVTLVVRDLRILNGRLNDYLHGSLYDARTGHCLRELIISNCDLGPISTGPSGSHVDLAQILGSSDPAKLPDLTVRGCYFHDSQAGNETLLCEDQLGRVVLRGVKMERTNKPIVIGGPATAIWIIDSPGLVVNAFQQQNTLVYIVRSPGAVVNASVQSANPKPSTLVQKGDPGFEPADTITLPGASLVELPIGASPTTPAQQPQLPLPEPASSATATNPPAAVDPRDAQILDLQGKLSALTLELANTRTELATAKQDLVNADTARDNAQAALNTALAKISAARSALA